MTKVLIVDDKEENLYYLEALLKGNGCEIESARHGAEALVKARKNPPDLVVSDLLMPVMDGYTLLRHWKADERLRESPFIVYTATYTEAEDERLALNLGADAFILKPAEPEDFLARLREVQANAAAAIPTLPKNPIGDEKALLKVYSETLIRKLEEKTLQLEETNRALEQDIAERKRIEEDLRQRELELEQLAEGLTVAQTVGKVGSWETNLQTMDVTWSEQTHRIFETDPNTFKPTHATFLEIVHPDDRAMVDSAFQNSFHQDQSCTIEHRIVLPDGRIKIVEERWRAFHDNREQALRCVGTCQDITERKQAELSLRESEQRFRQLAENINEVFWLTEPSKNQMLYISPAYEKIWGRSCESLYQLPMTWLESIHPDDRERITQAALTKQARGEYDEIYRILRPDGTLRWISDRAFPVTNEKGEVYRIVGTAEDITEKKKLEAQFLRTQRMESVGTLAGGIAHDLNNVLSPILMSIQILQSKISDKEGQSVLETLETCTQRGADLVRQVLSFARGMDGQRVTVNLRHLGRDIEKIIHETFPKKIEFSSHFATDLWPITGDPTQMHQVLMNLCVNARDAMPSGGKLKVSMENIVLDEVYAGMNPESRPGAYVMIQVEDNGTGIPLEIRDKIFEPFFTTKELGNGTGLGLSTTSAIVKSHAGFINLYTETGKGTRFKVYFPCEVVPSLVEIVTTEKSKFPRGNGERILIVDDEESIRNVAQKTLERYGYTVLLAANGVEAVSLYAQRHADIDIVLTDMAMPFMDGPMTIAALKSMNPAIKIIGSSGLADNAMLAKALSGGIQHFVPKPYTAETLLKVLQKALTKQSTGKEETVSGVDGKKPSRE